MRIGEWAEEFSRAFDKQLSDYTNENIVKIYGCKILGGNERLYYFDDMYNKQPKIKDYVVVENRNDIALAKVVAYVEIPQNMVSVIANAPLSGMKQIISIFDKNKVYESLGNHKEKTLDDILEE